MRYENVGETLFIDEENDFHATVNYANKGGFNFYIYQNGEKISHVRGNLARIRIDDVKYFDYRYVKPYKMCIYDETLPSSFKHRKDLQYLDDGRND